MNESFETPSHETISVDMPPIFESKADYDARMEREFAAYREIGRKYAEQYEQQILAAILKSPVIVKQPTPEEAEEIKRLCAEQDGPLTISRDVQVLQDKLLDTIREAHNAAGCKPGESLVERCRMLNEFYESGAVRGSLSSSEARTVLPLLPAGEAIKKGEQVCPSSLAQTIVRGCDGPAVFAGDDIKPGDMVFLCNDGLVRAARNGTTWPQQVLHEPQPRTTDFEKVAAMLEREAAYTEAKAVGDVVVQQLLDAVMPKTEESKNQTWRDRPPLL